ncbi:MAG: adenylyltransferase/cytidyltransferase family protein [Candidatus Krumholzibacteriota bacterium]|nr:adenylyltransferase/cytidyltransferase family protein [Candidatus Krumholzibacteriota bacterium]
MKRIFDKTGELMIVLGAHREAGMRIVLANGCFDILHAGHIRYLEEAAREGEIMVVAINDDASARKLKGAGRPVVPDVERAEILAALRCVDYILIFPGLTADLVIRELRPDVHAKGTDYMIDDVPELESSISVGCRTIITGDRKSRSSSEIIARVRGKD